MSGTRRLTASVVIVSCDRASMLRLALESLTRQTQTPDEVLVIHNGASPGYAELFQEFRARLPLRDVVEPQRGIPAARNRGIQEATCDLILFTDDDCEADPGWVEALSAPFARNPHIGAVGGEILSPPDHGSLVEQFCNAEALMKTGAGKTG